METKKLSELKEMAKLAKIAGFSKMSKAELIDQLKIRDQENCEGGLCPLRENSPRKKETDVPMDFNTELSKIAKTKLVNKAKTLGIAIKSKLDKKEILDEIISELIKRLFQELTE